MSTERLGTPEPRAPGHDNEVVRAARVLEWLKAELVAGVGNVMRASARGREDVLVDGLADLIMQAYLLARRLGINWTRLEMRIEDRLRQNIDGEHQLEQWYGDLTALANHYRRKDAH